MQKWASHLCSPRVPSWVNMSGPLILFGLYCGFIAALPPGLYHLLLARIAPASDRGIGSGSVISSSIIGQLVIILSVYHSRTYVTLVKPHAITLLVFPYILLCRHCIRRHLRLNGEEGVPHTTTGLRAAAAAGQAYAVTSRNITVRRNTLLDISLVSLSHYVFLVSPAPARLVKLIIHRHSDQLIFAISSIFGWLGGSILLKHLVELLAVPGATSYGSSSGPGLVDGSPINRISSIIVTALRLLYLGRSPLPVPATPFHDKWHELRPDGGIPKLLWLHAWPTSVFDYRKGGVRPFRYVKNYYNTASPIRKGVSQRFFHVCVGNGRRRLSPSFLPSPSIFGGDPYGYVNTAPDNPPEEDSHIHQEWVRLTGQKGSSLSKESTDRPEALEHGYSSIEVTDTETGSYGRGKSVFAKNFDPCPSKKLRGRVIVDLRSAWAFTRGSCRKVPYNFARSLYPSHASATGGRGTRNRRRKPPSGVISRSNCYVSAVRRLLQTHDARSVPIFKRKPQTKSALVPEVSLGAGHDIRGTKVKNVDYVTNDRTGITRVRKRPVMQPDYRRNLVIGSMRARRRKTLVWELLQYRTKSALSLRLSEKSASLHSMPYVNSESIYASRPSGEEPGLKHPDSHAATAVAEVTRIAGRGWDFSTAHWVRGCLLISQAYIRRNIVLPTLIILKNIGYLVAFQTTDWAEDWKDLRNEIYVGCNYEGAEVASKGLPPQWYKEGVQIKVVNPFYLEHRYIVVPKQSIMLGHHGDKEIDPAVSTRARSYGRGNPGEDLGYGYLTTTGYQASLPFGGRRRQAPPFWAPFLRDAKRKWGGKVSGIKKIISVKFLSRFGRGPNLYAGHRKPPVGTSTGGPRGDSVPGVEPGGHERYSYGLSGGSNDSSVEEVTLGSECLRAATTPGLSKYMARLGIEELESLAWSDGRAGDQPVGSPRGEGVSYGSPSGEDQRHIDGPFPSKTPIPMTRATRGVHTRPSHQIMIRLGRALFRNARRIMLSYRTLSTCFNVRLVRRLTRHVVRFRNYAGTCFGRWKDCSESNTRSFGRAGNSTTGRGGIVLPARRSWGMRSISRAYALCAIWRLSLKKCPRSIDIDSERRKLRFSVKRDTHFPAVSSEEQGKPPGGEPQAMGRRAWKKRLRDLQRYDVPMDVWRGIASQGWHTKVGRLYNDPRGRDQSMGISIAIPPHATSTGATPAGVTQVGKINKRCNSNLMLQSHLGLAPPLADAQVCPCSVAQQGEVFASNACARSGIGRDWVINCENGGKTRGRISGENGINSNLRLWLYIGVLNRFHILEMPKCEATCSLKSFTYDPDISFIVKRTFAIDPGKPNWVVSGTAREGLIDRWDFRSEQVAAGMARVQDTLSSLHALTAVSDPAGSSRLESIYERMLIDTDLLLHYARATRARGALLENLGHRIPVAVSDQFLACKMLSVSLNLQHRFKVILYLVSYEEPMPRIRVLGNRNRTISYSSHIGDALLPERRAELGILESLHGGEPDSGNQELERQGSAAGSREQQNGEPPARDRRGMEAETRILKNIIWPYHRLEDLSFTNRFWLNTSEGSRFAMLRVCLYS
uniref:Protein TIC 214 n=1 Tax=Selaginella indica TaxID=189559 RepID=A0A410KKE7_9TRAC|nr:hypothetical chloroplast RF19 [Selaginella indica]QAR48677.1 hypothetical chloroplast RF19 [Selaginella indica]